MSEQKYTVTVVYTNTMGGDTRVTRCGRLKEVTDFIIQLEGRGHDICSVTIEPTPNIE